MFHQEERYWHKILTTLYTLLLKDLPRVLISCITCFSLAPTSESRPQVSTMPENALGKKETSVLDFEYIFDTIWRLWTTELHRWLMVTTNHSLWLNFLDDLCIFTCPNALHHEFKILASNYLGIYNHQPLWRD